MYLKYGNYQHEASECSIAIARRSLLTEQKVMYAYVESWQIIGRLQAADVPALTAAIAALEAAYYIANQDIGLYNDDGTPTDHVMRASETNGGIVLVSPPAFPEGRNAEYSTFRNYSITLEAEFQYAGGNRLLSWMETLSFRGTCGPLWGFLATINGWPEQQLFRQQTTMLVTQNGQATGLGGYPIPAGPIWPSLEHQEQRSIVLELPSERSRRRSVSWSYVFESSNPLSGLPTSSEIN